MSPHDVVLVASATEGGRTLMFSIDLISVVAGQLQRENPWLTERTSRQQAERIVHELFEYVTAREAAPDQHGDDELTTSLRLIKGGSRDG